jgi:cyclic pyranopterin phosphate synthase
MTFSHLDEHGHVHMVDVGDKDVTARTAVAEGVLRLSTGTRDQLFSGMLPKGDALASARVAGIMGAKRTSELIPLCHPLPIDSVSVEIEQCGEGALLTATVSTTGRTGVEMEALTAVAVAGLALYDMVKSVERGAELGQVRLVKKSGGRSGLWERQAEPSGAERREA